MTTSDWTISRDAAGTWLRCHHELEGGGSIKIDAPTLTAIRLMEQIDESVFDQSWLEDAKKAAAP